VVGARREMQLPYCGLQDLLATRRELAELDYLTRQHVRVAGGVGVRESGHLSFTAIFDTAVNQVLCFMRIRSVAPFDRNKGSEKCGSSRRLC